MAFTSIQYSRHARDQMEKRRIGEGQVVNTLNNLDQTRVSRDRLIAERATTAGNIIRVVYVEKLTDSGRVAHVVTVIRITP